MFFSVCIFLFCITSNLETPYTVIFDKISNNSLLDGTSFRIPDNTFNWTFTTWVRVSETTSSTRLMLLRVRNSSDDIRFETDSSFRYRFLIFYYTLPISVTQNFFDFHSIEMNGWFFAGISFNNSNNSFGIFASSQLFYPIPYSTSFSVNTYLDFNILNESSLNVFYAHGHFFNTNFNTEAGFLEIKYYPKKIIALYSFSNLPKNNILLLNLISKEKDGTKLRNHIQVPFQSSYRTPFIKTNLDFTFLNESPNMKNFVITFKFILTLRAIVQSQNNYPNSKLIIEHYRRLFKQENYLKGIVLLSEINFKFDLNRFEVKTLFSNDFSSVNLDDVNFVNINQTSKSKVFFTKIAEDRQIEVFGYLKITHFHTHEEIVRDIEVSIPKFNFSHDATFLYNMSYFDKHSFNIDYIGENPIIAFVELVEFLFYTGVEINKITDSNGDSYFIANSTVTLKCAKGNFDQLRTLPDNGDVLILDSCLENSSKNKCPSFPNCAYCKQNNCLVCQDKYILQNSLCVECKHPDVIYNNQCITNTTILNYSTLNVSVEKNMALNYNTIIDDYLTLQNLQNEFLNNKVIVLSVLIEENATNKTKAKIYDKTLYYAKNINNEPPLNLKSVMKGDIVSYHSVNYKIIDFVSQNSLDVNSNYSCINLFAEIDSNTLTTTCHQSCPTGQRNLNDICIPNEIGCDQYSVNSVYCNLCKTNYTSFPILNSNGKFCLSKDLVTTSYVKNPNALYNYPSCSSNCIYCLNSSNCLLCKSSYKIVNGMCVLETCLNTYPHCISCDGNSNCVKCETNYQLTNGNCVIINDCSKYESVYLNLCLNCMGLNYQIIGNSCVHCSETTEFQCVPCDQGFLEVERICVEKCLLKKGCLNCNTNHEDCNLCQENFTLIANQNEIGCIPNNQVINFCKLYEFDFPLKEEISLNVPKCLECDTEKTCIKLDVNKIYCDSCESLQLVEYCITYNKNSPAECEHCENGYFLNVKLNLCLEGIKNCKIHSIRNNVTHCEECEENFFQTVTITPFGEFYRCLPVEKKIQNCFNYSNDISLDNTTCLTCEEGTQKSKFLNDVEGCIPRNELVPNCLVYNKQNKCEIYDEKCIDSSNTCLTCFKENNKDEKCYSECVSITCEECNNKCRDYFCLKSVKNCITCDPDNFSICLDCKKDYYLENNQCKQLVPVDFVYDLDLPCPPGCLCMEENICFKCAFGFNFIEDDCIQKDNIIQNFVDVCQNETIPCIIEGEYKYKECEKCTRICKCSLNSLFSNNFISCQEKVIFQLSQETTEHGEFLITKNKVGDKLIIEFKPNSQVTKSDFVLDNTFIRLSENCVVFSKNFKIRNVVLERSGKNNLSKEIISNLTQSIATNAILFFPSWALLFFYNTIQNQDIFSYLALIEDFEGGSFFRYINSQDLKLFEVGNLLDKAHYFEIQFILKQHGLNNNDLVQSNVIFSILLLILGKILFLLFKLFWFLLSFLFCCCKKNKIKNKKDSPKEKKKPKKPLKKKIIDFFKDLFEDLKKLFFNMIYFILIVEIPEVKKIYLFHNLYKSAFYEILFVVVKMLFIFLSFLKIKNHYDFLKKDRDDDEDFVEYEDYDILNNKIYRKENFILNLSIFLDLIFYLIKAFLINTFKDQPILLAYILISISLIYIAIFVVYIFKVQKKFKIVFFLIVFCEVLFLIYLFSFFGIFDQQNLLLNILYSLINGIRLIERICLIVIIFNLNKKSNKIKVKNTSSNKNEEFNAKEKNISQKKERFKIDLEKINEIEEESRSSEKIEEFSKKQKINKIKEESISSNEFEEFNIKQKISQNNNQDERKIDIQKIPKILLNPIYYPIDLDEIKEKSVKNDIFACGQMKSKGLINEAMQKYYSKHILKSKNDL